MSIAIDIDHLKGWTGREEEAHDRIDARLVASLRATLGEEPGEPREGEAAPLCVHWCLAPPIVANGATGPDGHPARGGFLPPVPLPRRMWAGGHIAFHAPLRVGDAVTRRSRIGSVALKEGRTGRLCFVSVHHDYANADGPCVSERHDIVYRDAPTAMATSSTVAPALPQADAAESFDPSTLVLFRYSALTFNGHRIHYDRAYARDEELYPGLVVHGPLQATLLVRLAARTLGRMPAEISYRGVSPLFDGDGLLLEARRDGDGLSLRAANAAGATTMEARAR